MILAPQAGIILALPALKGRDLNTGLPRKSHCSVFCSMPLEGGFADMVVSFFGVANMLGIVEKGVQEASRITKTDGRFLNGFLVIKGASQGFNAVRKICEENNMAGAERTYLDEVMKELHGKYFPEVVAHEVVADVRENTENTMDLLPYQGEWFAYMTYEGRK